MITLQVLLEKKNVSVALKIMQMHFNFYMSGVQFPIQLWDKKGS